MKRKRIVSVVALVMMVALLVVCLAACSPSSVEKSLVKKGYDVITTEVNSEKVDSQLYAIDGINMVNVTWFTKSSYAEEAYEDAVRLGVDENCLYRLGKVFYNATTEKALKDAK